MTINKGRRSEHSKRTCGEAKKLTSEPRNVHKRVKFIVCDLKFIVVSDCLQLSLIVYYKKQFLLSV